MAKKKASSVTDEEDKDKPKRYSITIDQDLVRKLKLVAAADDVSPPDWVNNRLRRLLDEELTRALRELNLPNPRE